MGQQEGILSGQPHQVNVAPPNRLALHLPTCKSPSYVPFARNSPSSADVSLLQFSRCRPASSMMQPRSPANSSLSLSDALPPLPSLSPRFIERTDVVELPALQTSSCGFPCPATHGLLRPVAASRAQHDSFAFVALLAKFKYATPAMVLATARIPSPSLGLNFRWHKHYTEYPASAESSNACLSNHCAHGRSLLSMPVENGSAPTKPEPAPSRRLQSHHGMWTHCDAALKPDHKENLCPDPYEMHTSVTPHFHPCCCRKSTPSHRPPSPYKEGISRLLQAGSCPAQGFEVLSLLLKLVPHISLPDAPPPVACRHARGVHARSVVQAHDVLQRSKCLGLVKII